MAMEQGKEVTNIGETSNTSEATEYYISIAEPTRGSAQAPTLLKEYQSKDIKEDMAMEQAKEVTNDVGESPNTSEAAQYHTCIAEPTARPARVYPTLLREYQSKDIREVKRTGLADIKYVKKGKGTLLGEGGQATIHEVVVNTGVEHVGLNARYETYALKKFNGLSMDSLHGQWQEQVHGLKEHYGGFICEFYGYCRDYEAYEGSDDEEEVPRDGIFSKAATWVKKLASGEKYESAEESSFKMGSFCLLMKKYDCSLRNVLNEVKLKPGVAINMMVHIAVGMKIVHQEGILHRDLKADNVFVYKSEDNMPWGASIGDFDVAESVEGTRFWRAPEILEAIAERNRLRMEKVTLEEKQAVKVYIPWSPMADVYSYGMTCYEILTGGIPFKGINRKEELDCVVKQGLRPELPANLNPAIRDLIHSCWHQDPQQRPTFDAILLELKIILHEFPRFVARIVDEVKNLPPAKKRPSTEECIARLEQIEKELRAKYPEEFFVERDELDFVELHMKWTRTMKKFVTRFGYKSYINRPSLPWTQWFERMKGFVEVQQLGVQVGHAFPFLIVKKAISRWRLYITQAIFEGCEEDNSYPDEEGVIDDNQKLILLRNWNERDVPPFVNRHHGCVQMINHGHFEGSKDHPICDWCKEQEERDIIADVKFRVFDDKFVSERG